MINIKKDTAIKIIKRYIKGLAAMEQEAADEKLNSDAEHYKTDRIAMEQAVAIMERSNT